MTTRLGTTRSGFRRALLLLLATSGSVPLAAQTGRRDPGAVSIVIGAEPTLPVPALSSAKANVDVGSLLFLPLARLGRKLSTTDEKSFEPALARSWSRRDPTTLVFDLDPRAKWHDGVPVTSRDVVWSLNRFRDSTISPTYSLLLREIASVTAEGPGKVIVGFRRPYAEQLFDAVHHVWPLPAHLLDSIPAARLTASPLVTRPVGSGPFRWGALEPGQKLELTANRDFFLGRPGVDRVVFLFVRAAEAQLNLVLNGTADALEAFLLPRQIEPIVSNPGLRLKTQPSLNAGYLLFNQKAAGDRSRPHPILSDPAVRQAIALGIDRATVVRSVFGPYGAVIEGPMGQASWVRRVAPKAPGFDPSRARRILAERGWKDVNGDGILEKDGAPLSLRLAYPGSSIPRVASAELIQEMLRRIGVGLELARLEGPIWAERRGKGEFDIDFSQTTLDPTPSGMVQSWSCAGIGGTNVASICDPRFDTALYDAIRAGQDATTRWREAITILQSSTPAVFLFSPVQSLVVSTRFRNASVRPDFAWADLWRWSIEPGRAER